MATRFVKASYQEVIDLHTESGHVTAIGVHTPTGNTPRKMFRGYFDQYKKYRYAGAKITFAPVAKLPADPLSVSYEAGEPTIDPRDLANPILVHGCHGDDMGTILNKLYGDNSAISDGFDGLDVSNTDAVPSGVTSPYYAAMERLYYKALTDRTWKKAGIQRGFTKGGLRPLLYTLATNHQILPSTLLEDGGAHVNNAGQIVVNGGVPTSNYGDAYSVDGGGYELENPVDPTRIQFFTPHLTRLGWLDTRNVITANGLGTTDENISSGGSAALDGVNELVQSGLVDQINYVELPKLFMLCILLPPAYKTEMYFRAIITHYFQFKDFRGISFMPEQTGVPSYFNANDDLFDAATFEDVDIPFDDNGGSTGGLPDDPDDPSEPVKVYTYSSSEEIAIGSTTGTLYSSLKDGDDSCSLRVTVSGNSTNLARIIVNPVPAFDQTNYYFCDAYMTVCILASNAIMGGTHPYYSYNATSHDMVQSGTVTIHESTPTDYFDTIKSGNFELQQRS